MKKHPEVPEYQDSLARSHNSLGTLYRDTGRAKEAEAAYREALAIRKPLAQRHPEVPDYQDNLAGSHNNLGNLYSDTGRLKEAEAACKKAIAIRRLLVEKHSEVPAYQDHLAASQYALGLFYSDTGRLKEAEAAYEEARTIWKALAKTYPQVPEYRNRLEACERDYELARVYRARRVAQHAAQASWSPDGKRLVCAKQPFGSGLQVCDLATGKIADVVAPGKDPAWSPGDGRWIAFVRGSSAADEEVWLIASDGQHARKIADGGCPSWSADGKRVFFVRGRDSKLMVVNAGERDARPGAVMDLRGALHPAVSPDGTRVAFVGGSRISVIDVGTKKVLMQAAIAWKDGLAAWSPDGKRVAFTSFGMNDDQGLWICKVKDGHPVRVIRGSCAMPAWSADGSLLAFDIRVGDRAGVWVVETKNLEKAE